MHRLLNALHSRFVFARRVQRLAATLGEMIPGGSRVLDVGCGDGQLSALIAQARDKISVTGIDVLLRPKRHIPVRQFDGNTIPFQNSSFDVVMFVDVLHHTKNPAALLTEARRVTNRYILLKDHFRTGPVGGMILRLMDWVGNIHHGVTLPYNYLSKAEWTRIYESLGLQPVKSVIDLHLYPPPADLVFGRGLHFITLLEKSAS